MCVAVCFFLFKTSGQLLMKCLIKSRVRNAHDCSYKMHHPFLNMEDKWERESVTGQLGTAGSGLLGTALVACIRAQLVPGHWQVCSAQCFSCVVYLVWTWLQQGCAVQILWFSVGTNRSCVTVLSPHCAVTWEILQSLEWRNNRNHCFLPVPLRIHCWDAGK